MTTVHGLSVQLSETATSLADWRLQIERSQGRSAKTIDALDHELRLMTTELERLRSEWEGTLKELRTVLDDIDVETRTRRA
jgi:hypothetical protein